MTILYICCIPVRGYGFKENEASEEMVECLERLRKNTEGGDDGGAEPKICVAETSSVNDNKKKKRENLMKWQESILAC